MSTSLSVIIPTYNRGAVLRQTLEALLRDAQGASAGAAAQIEVVVVDDGSTDDTAQVLAQGLAVLPRTASPVEVRTIRQENRGAAAARNAGLRCASGQIVLFIDSDIMAAPGLLMQHMRSHGSLLSAHNDPAPAPLAVLGHLALAPGLPATPMNLNHVIHKWRGLHDGQELDWRFFVTGNVSVPRAFLLDNDLWFDESLPFLEDTELGYRAAKQGMRIIYNAQALGYHNHNLTLEGYARLNQRYGETLAELHGRRPELKQEWDSYLPFSWRNPPRRIARDLLRPLVLNRLSVAVLLRREQAAERAGRCPSAAAVRRIGNYYERLGYRHSARSHPSSTLQGLHSAF